jgi:16S rRNA G527 N7-methylase RsmG
VVIAAICLPQIQFVSLEPVHKKHAFLRTAARELDLPNLDARAERLEDHRATDYDAAMSRATFDLREWLEAGAKRVVPGGFVLGFEAVRRDDLPGTVERHAYNIDGKPRTIVVLPITVAAAVR